MGYAPAQMQQDRVALWRAFVDCLSALSELVGVWLQLISEALKLAVVSVMALTVVPWLVLAAGVACLLTPPPRRDRRRLRRPR